MNTQGSFTDTPFLEVICALHTAKKSGCLSLSQGNSQRSFFFQEGVLVATESTDESEGLEHIRSSLPDASEAQLRELQGTIRMLNSTGSSDGEWEFLPDASPPYEGSLDLEASCWKAVQRKLEATDIRQRLQEKESEYPTISGAKRPISSLPVKPNLREFLETIDGQRTLGEILDFAPLDPDVAARALYLGHLLGAIHIQQESREVGITTASEPESPAPAEASSVSKEVMDIASLIAGEVGEPIAIPKEDPHSEEPTEPLSGDPEMRALQETHNKLEAAEDFFALLGVEWDADDETYRRTYFELARTYHPDAWAEKPDEQVEMVDRIFALISEAWQELGESESRQAYVDKVIHGLKDENELAMERVKEILKAESDFDKAVAHFKAGRIVQAHEILQSCVEQVPDAPEFRAYLGYTTWKLHIEREPETAEAGETMLKEAMEQSVKLDDGWVLLGLLYKAKDLEDLAKMSFIKALKINPSNESAVREMKRLNRDKKEDSNSGLLKRLFTRKKS